MEIVEKVTNSGHERVLFGRDAASGYRADEKMPIDMTGVFTDQGVVSEKTVGKTVGQRTVSRVENTDRHIFQLYFTPPGGIEQLANRSIYTRMK